jgi:hypothetical protein
MQPAQEGIFKRCRGFAALLVALCGTFAAASRHDTAPGTTGNSADNGSISVNLQDWVARARLDTDAAEVNCTNLDALIDDDNVIESDEVGINASSLFLPVTIDAQKWWFLVDTGCSETVVDKEVAIHVGLIDRQDPNLRERWKGIHRTLSATVGKSRFPLECRAKCFDLSHLRECIPEFPLCGILGMDFLRRHVIGIDLDAGKLSFLKSVPMCPGSDLKLSRDSYDRPLLRVEIAQDNDVWFVVDTGCAGPYAGAIEKSIFNNLVDRNQLTDVRGPITRMTFYGKRKCDEARLDVFQIGSFEHSDLPFHDHNSVNLLGLEYLSRYVVTIDFRNDFLYLKEGKRFAKSATPGTEQKGVPTDG